MRLVMVTHAYPRRAGDVAGAFIARLAEALVARSHTVTVVAPADRGTAQRFTLNGVEVVQVRYAAPERENLAYTGQMVEQARSVSGLRAFLSLVRALASGARTQAARLNTRLLHAHWWIPAGWGAVRTGLSTVVTLHGTDVRLLRWLPARVLARRVLRRACRVTAVSRYLAVVAQVDADIIPLPTETSAFTRASEGGGGIAVLGRLTAQKRVDLVFRAVAGAGITAPVTVIGDGPERAVLERLADALQLRNVRFTGAVAPAAVPAALGDADVLAFPAKAEGYGLAAAEALLLGIPVVTTEDAGGVLDVVADGAGGHVVPATPEALGGALRSCLANPTARAVARRIGQTLRARLSADAVAAAFEGVYARCA